MEKTATSLPMDERASLLAEWSLAAPPNAAVPASLHWLARGGEPGRVPDARGIAQGERSCRRAGCEPRR